MFSHQYIKMCIEGREDIEFVRVFNSTEGGWLGNFAFKKGDYFNHPKLGENEVREVAQLGKSDLRAVDDPYPYRVEECIWIPTADQLIDEAGEMPFSIMNKEDLKKYYEGHYLSDPNISDEERVLSYFVENRHKKAWDFEKQKWIDIET